MTSLNIVVYCSSRENIPQSHKDCATQLGTWIGQHHHNLIYGGVHAGLMSITAQAAHDNHATIIGIVPEMFMHRASHLNHQLIPTTDLNHRKSRMIELGHLFVVLPGGLGTLDEWLATLSHLISTGLHHTILIVNLDGIYDHLIAQLRATAASPFAHGNILSRMVIVTSTHDMITQLNNITNNQQHITI